MGGVVATPFPQGFQPTDHVPVAFMVDVWERGRHTGVFPAWPGT